MLADSAPSAPAGIRRTSATGSAGVSADEGGSIARAIGESIITEADSLQELYGQVRDAVRCHFDDAARPRMIRLHFVRDEVIAA